VQQIGRALVDRCLERARELGRPTLGIHTIALLTDAVRLYERMGFGPPSERLMELRVSDRSRR